MTWLARVKQPLRARERASFGLVTPQPFLVGWVGNRQSVEPNKKIPRHDAGGLTYLRGLLYLRYCFRVYRLRSGSVSCLTASTHRTLSSLFSLLIIFLARTVQSTHNHLLHITSTVLV